MKNPSNVMYYEDPKTSDDSAGGDFQQLFSFVMAFAGTWMKSKLCIWGALFFLLSSFATMKSKSANYMQLILNLGLIVMGFLSLYIWIPRQEAQMLQMQQEEKELQQ